MLWFDCEFLQVATLQGPTTNSGCSAAKTSLLASSFIFSQYSLSTLLRSRNILRFFLSFLSINSLAFLLSFFFSFILRANLSQVGNWHGGPAFVGIALSFVAAAAAALFLLSASIDSSIFLSGEWFLVYLSQDCDLSLDAILRTLLQLWIGAWCRVSCPVVLCPLHMTLHSISSWRKHAHWHS